MVKLNHLMVLKEEVDTCFYIKFMKQIHFLSQFFLIFFYIFLSFFSFGNNYNSNEIQGEGTRNK